jgi:glycosyltransferase involved in cell wall biosynthesis
MMMSSVLHVSDTAGVARALCAAFDSFSAWDTELVDLPSTAAGRGRVMHGLGVPLRAARVPGAVRRAMTIHSPDVVHLHWARFAPLMPASARPLVVHAHGSDVRHRLNGVGGRFVQRALERADAILASTPDLLDDLPDFASVLPNPIDVDFFTPAEGMLGRRLTVLLFARLVPIKGGATLLAFADRLRNARPDVEVVGFGGGTLDSAARRAGVRLLPPTDREGVRRVLRGADVVIGQQHLGVLGLSELEAMSCERPVIAALHPQFREADLPLIASVDIDQMLNVCVDLLDDPLSRCAIGRAGRRFVIERHRPEVVVEQLERLYEGLR